MDRRHVLKIGTGTVLGALSDLSTLFSPLKPPSVIAAVASTPMGSVEKLKILQLALAHGVSRSVYGINRCISLLESGQVTNPYQALVNIAEGVRTAFTSAPSDALVRRYIGPDMSSKLDRLMSSDSFDSFSAAYNAVLKEEGDFITLPKSQLEIDREQTQTRGSLLISQVRRTRWIPKKDPIRSSIEGIDRSIGKLVNISPEIQRELAPVHALSARLARFREETGALLSGEDPATILVNNLYKLVISNQWDKVFDSPEIQLVIKFQGIWNLKESQIEHALKDVEKELTLFDLDPGKLELAEAQHRLPTKKRALVPHLLFALRESHNYFLGSKRVGYFPPLLRKCLNELGQSLANPRTNSSLLRYRISQAMKIVRGFSSHGEEKIEY